MNASTVLGQVVDVLALLLVPPLLLGVINRVKAKAGGRRGQPLLQAYRDLARLLRKGLVFSETTTWIFRAAPIVTLVATLLAGLLIPLGGGGPVGFEGDLILFVYLFALGRFFTTAAALDTGSPFEGMGAAREVTWAALTEPAVFFVLISLASWSDSLSLDTMLLAPAGPHAATLVLSAAGLFIVLLVECSRVPFDDPNTHLELTMVHEVMVLDHSGPLFAAVLYGAAMKLFILATLLVRLVTPHLADAWATRGVVLAGVLAVAVVIGVVESTTARVRLARIPNLVSGAALVTAVGFLLAVR
ncbi:MAG: hydrogenase [Deltaproteobacteria bacterium]|nr:MAG: hydrogenase [Deltaproteobacteria bacterium]